MPPSFSIGILVIVAATGLFLWSERGKRRLYAERRRRLGDRGEMSMDDWYERHFEPRGLSYQATRAVSEILAGSIGCHPTNLRPTDSFLEELYIPRLHRGLDDDDEMEEFLTRLDAWLGGISRDFDRRVRRGLDGRFADVRTLGDLISCVEPFLTKKAAVAGLRDDDVGDVA